MNDKPAKSDNPQERETPEPGWRVNGLRTWLMELFEKHRFAQPLAILLTLVLIIGVLSLFGIRREGIVVVISLGAFAYVMYLLVYWAHTLPPSALRPDLVRGLRFVWYLSLVALFRPCACTLAR
jgi:hypothetical protein